MFKPDTLIVLGAAASKDFGFPLGSELKKAIADLLAVGETDYGEPKLYEHNQHLFRSLQTQFPCQDVFLAARMIAGGVGLTSSIDNFLEMRKDEPIIIACAKGCNRLDHFEE
jgi:hypothetical protein